MDKQLWKNNATTNAFDIWPQLEITIKRDPVIKEHISDMLSNMTLAEKVTQTIQIQPEICDITVNNLFHYRLKQAY